MTVDSRMAFERRQPSVDLRAFLDPLKPGSYFDCGEARLYGIDEALEAEAQRRGRAVGDDEFQLVATDGGLIFCRASIMFAIAARWKDLTIGRPESGSERDAAILPITWPTHGDLQFTVSRRLGSNVFRRWLQLQAQATRRNQVERDGRIEPADGRVDELRGSERHDGIEVADSRNGEPGDLLDGLNGLNGSTRSPSAESSSTLHLDAFDREAIQYATRQEQLRRRQLTNNGAHPATNAGAMEAPVDPLATLDAAVVDEWVDDRIPSASTASARTDGRTGDTPTADPFENHAVRFEARPPTDQTGLSDEDRADATSTHFMKTTVDGTDIFPDQRSDPRAGNPDATRAGHRSDNEGGARRRNGPLAAPVPEISSARLHAADGSDVGDGPNLDIRGTLLADRRDTDWVEKLRERQVLILGAVTVVALVLIALIGFVSGDGGRAEISAGVAADASLPTGVESGASTTGIPPAAGDAIGASSTSISPTLDGETDTGAIESTVPSLRVTSTSVQICHSNYGGCVPVAADVDCEGDGDGPAFQATPVAVFGDDVYGLDTDDDREACEPDQPRTATSGGDG